MCQSPCQSAQTSSSCKETEGVCQTCGRTLTEIAEWSEAPQTRKKEIVKVAKERRTKREIEESLTSLSPYTMITD